MALKQTITLTSGLEIPDAYIRIDTVNGYKGSLDISVNSYVSQEKFEAGNDYIESKMFTFTPSVADDSENFIRQGYHYLKSLPEFEDATDV